MIMGLVLWNPEYSCQLEKSVAICVVEYSIREECSNARLASNAARVQYSPVLYCNCSAPMVDLAGIRAID
jgi:hypothetical protein